MTAELAEDVTLTMPQSRDWTWEDLRHTPVDGRRWEIIDGSLHLRAGESVAVDVPFPAELRPAELVGPRRKD